MPSPGSGSGACHRHTPGTTQSPSWQGDAGDQPSRLSAYSRKGHRAVGTAQGRRAREERWAPRRKGGRLSQAVGHRAWPVAPGMWPSATGQPPASVSTAGSRERRAACRLPGAEQCPHSAPHRQPRQRELQAPTLCPGSRQGPLSSPLNQGAGGCAPKSLCQARGDPRSRRDEGSRL